MTFTPKKRKKERLPIYDNGEFIAYSAKDLYLEFSQAADRYFAKKGELKLIQQDTLLIDDDE